MYAKKHTGIATLGYDESVEEALCFGWIDSLRQPVDDRFWRMAFTPRKPKSAWSAPNRARVAKMVKAGLMTAAGLALVTLAKQTGRWEARKAAENLEMPSDLRRALHANDKAKQQWPAYPPSLRRGFLNAVYDAKKPETRARRIARIVDLVARRVSPADLRAERRRRSDPGPSRG